MYLNKFAVFFFFNHNYFFVCSFKIFMRDYIMNVLAESTCVFGKSGRVVLITHDVKWDFVVTRLHS